MCANWFSRSRQAPLGLDHHLLLLRRLPLSLDLLQIPSIETLTSAGRQGIRPSIWDDLRRSYVRNDARFSILHLVLGPTYRGLVRISRDDARYITTGGVLLLHHTNPVAQRGRHVLVFLRLRDVLRRLLSHHGKFEREDRGRRY